ncbi:hypothetical protein GHK86_05925 [Acidimicrobiaceae bacterium USS-CC1]|uniref:EamA family transporter n=1 Tax=Acidiferrimicrobium australe TaxID=2664430 RepID=A0ABW9QSC2_9ACTN|nr:hypothetical protein [Acidiferrimicrobium australe]
MIGFGEVVTYGLAVLAALANATSSTLQRRANRDEPDDVAFTPRIMLDLLRRPVWLGGILAVIAGFLLQAGALSRGNLAVVEPVLTLELPFTLGLASVVFKARLRVREWTSAAVLTGGVVLLLIALSPRGGSSAHVPLYEWCIGLAVNLGAVGILVARGLRAGPAARAALLGVATGAMFGLTAALMTRMSVGFASGVVGALTMWQTYAMIATGGAAMYLLQNALQAGTLVAVQPGLTLTDPLVSIIWGVIVFHEHVNGGLWYLVAIVAGGMLILGTVWLSNSPLIHGQQQPGGEQAGGEQAGEGRPSGGRPGREHAGEDQTGSNRDGEGDTEGDPQRTGHPDGACEEEGSADERRRLSLDDPTETPATGGAGS